MPKAATRVNKPVIRASAPPEFREDGQKGEKRGDVHGPGKETHRAFKTVAAKPAQGFLGAVREDHRAEAQAEEKGGGFGIAAKEKPGRPEGKRVGVRNGSW